MDWIQRIENAIDYVEENITEKINYEEVAKRAYSSSFHFQKVFSITCGFTLGEYIRRRKLTLAGNDLLSKKMSSDGSISCNIIADIYLVLLKFLCNSWNNGLKYLL